MYLSKHQKTIRETSTTKNPYRIPNLHAPRSNFRFPKQPSLSRGSSRNSKTDCCELPKKPPALRKQSTNTQHQSCPILRDVETIIRSRQVPSFLTSKSTSTDTQTGGTGKRANYSIDWFANEQGEEEPPAAGWPGLVVSKNYTFLVQCRESMLLLSRAWRGSVLRWHAKNASFRHLDAQGCRFFLAAAAAAAFTSRLWSFFFLYRFVLEDPPRIAQKLQAA